MRSSQLARYLARMSDSVSHDLESLVIRYEKALRGISSCSTECRCCKMHNRIARRALGEKIPYGEPEAEEITGRQIPQVI